MVAVTKTKSSQDTKMIKQSGVEYYYQNGLFHRTNGPAVFKPGKIKGWYIRGVKHFSITTYQEMAGLSDKEMSDLLVLFDGF